MTHRLLVTGGAGFIGSALVRRAARRADAALTVLDLAEPADGMLPSGVDVVRGDILDRDLLDALVADADVVVHCAAHSHNDYALANPRPFVETNLVGTFEVLEAVRRHGTRLHHVSTDEVFGSLAPGDPPFTERSPYAPRSPYSSTKAGSDLLVRAWVQSYGVRATLSNCGNNYGPFQSVDKFIPRQITRMLRGHPPRVFGTGEQVRDWIHVDDHAAAVWAIVDRGRSGETYAIGAATERSNLDIARALRALIDGAPDRIEHVADRAAHDSRYAIDASKITDELAWRPERRDLAAGLAETVAWYRANEDFWGARVDEVEGFYAARDQ